MDLFGNWFKTQDSKNREQKEYNNVMFPFGERQKEIVSGLVKELNTKESFSLAFFYYLQIRQECENTRFFDGDYKFMYKVLKKNVSKKSSVDIFKYVVLAKYDSKIDESLNYPSIEEIAKEALDIENMIV